MSGGGHGYGGGGGEKGSRNSPLELAMAGEGGEGIEDVGGFQ